MELTAETVRQKKLVILILGIVIYFFTSMSKVLVPAAIFNELLALGTMTTAQIVALSSAFWYAYAASQLLAGIFSDRYGGVRILLVGGGMFALGTILFPLLGSFWPVILLRVLAGFGAGTAFIGFAKLIADVFPVKFGIALGTVLFIAFCGTSCGTTPMVMLVHVIGWQKAMMVPGFIVLAALIGIACFARGTIKPTVPGHTFGPLARMSKNLQMWLICLSSSIMFGAYYVILNQIGKKCFEDFYGISPVHAANFMLALTILVAAGNVGVNALLKLAGNRRKVIALFAGLCTLAGSIIAWCCFARGAGVAPLFCAFVLLAIPGGFFPLFGMIGKELNPPEDTGLAVAIVNFMAAVMIAIFQNIGGAILDRYPLAGNAFPKEAYAAVCLFLVIVALPGLIALFFVPETRPAKVTEKQE